MKKTTASVEQAVVIILQSVRRTRSRRRDFCVQMGFGVCTNKHPLAKWIARGIACRFLVPRMEIVKNTAFLMKARDPMRWMGLLNTLKAQAEEMIFQELIFQ